MFTCRFKTPLEPGLSTVGVPAKIGVSGEILCVIWGKMGICVFSPPLDAYGTSMRGGSVLHAMSERPGLQVFASEAEDAMLGDAIAP